VRCLVSFMQYCFFLGCFPQLQPRGACLCCSPFSIDDLRYRIDAGIECGWWNWVAILIQWVTGFCMCLGAMMVVVGSATYLAVNRPDARSSVAASQRSMQMIFAAIELAIGGILWDVIGPGLMHTAMGLAR
jgi:hypothetical protein